MHALRQKCRPKHQLLILKCYPKLPKNTTATEEIKPNGSELSYLLYYASSRRSKLTKVGIFLEKKTASDVKHSRTPAVMVTLQILAAFLNSSEVGGGKDGFGLFAPYVLRILQEVLGQGGSVDLVDEALPVWTSVCGHQDHATLAGDGGYRALFAGVVNTWAGFATKNGTRKTMGRLQHLSASDEIRIRKAGLEAMRAIATSEALHSEPQKQIDVVMDVVLQNLWGEDAAYLVMLDARDKAEKEGMARAQKEGTTRGRPSMNTVRTKTSEEGDARAAGGTAADADKIAEEEAGLLALRCLKSIYEVDNNRSQIRWATSCVLAYIAQQERPSSQSEKGVQTRPWATALVKMVCNWAPVQDRFVVLFTAVETLIRTPITEEQLNRQLVLSYIIGQVLASNTNLIGLSIMDILLGLVQHVLLVLQIGTQHPVLNAGDITSSDEDLKSSSNEKPPQSRGVQMEIVKTPSPARVQLLAQLRRCIASLATHVYYTDQISDMVSAILLRLKPSPAVAQHPAVVVSAIENPDTTAAEIASNSSLRERPNTDGFFSFDTAREVALLAVKDVMAVVNSTHHNGSTSHNPVPIGVWEGTQWLLRDPSEDVRTAYVDALCTWLVDETDRADRQLEDRAMVTKNRKENGNGAVARRAVSNASGTYRSGRRGHSTFLQLLHLAVYEQASQRADAADSDGEFLLLHLLLATLSEKLGINAVRTALPMIFRLQEDIQQAISPQAKIRLGSLVHGYLSSLMSIFGLGATFIGIGVASEITRRKQHNIWLDGIQVPPLPCAQIRTRAFSAVVAISGVAASMESLKPFDHRDQLVEALSEAYTASLATPVTSPPTSPGARSFSLPLLSDAAAIQGPTYLKPPSAAIPNSTRNIPAPVLEELSALWSKETVLAALAANAPKSLSLSGSRSGANGHNNGAPNSNIRNSNGSLLFDHRHLLASATFPVAKSADHSPTRSAGSGAAVRSRNVSRSGAAGGSAVDVRRATIARSTNSRTRTNTRGTAGTGTRTAGSSRRPSSTRTSSIGRGPGGMHNGLNPPGSRIEDLKRALATGNLSSVGVNAFGGLGGDAYSDEDDDDSMVEVEGSEFGDYPSSMVGPGESTAAAGGVDAMETIPDTSNEATPRPMAHLRDPMEDSYVASDDADAAATGSVVIAGLGFTAAEIGDSIVEIPPETTAESHIPALSLPGTFNLSPESASTAAPATSTTTPGGSVGNVTRPVSSAGSGFGDGVRPGSSSRSHLGRKDLASLLDSVGLEDGNEVVGVVTPPY